MALDCGLEVGGLPGPVAPGPGQMGRPSPSAVSSNCNSFNSCSKRPALPGHAPEPSTSIPVLSLLVSKPGWVEGSGVSVHLDLAIRAVVLRSAETGRFLLVNSGFRV